MNKTDKIEYEFQKAIFQNPINASLYNDYAVFLSKYRKDYCAALKNFSRAIKFDPQNKIYKSNFNKTIRLQENKINFRHNIFMIFLISVMSWIGINGYTNIMNLFSLFVIAQLVLSYKQSISKKLYSFQFLSN